VLRDEGEAYAARLRAAGVPATTVRYDGITHDFMILNPLSGTHATRAAVAQATSQQGRDQTDLDRPGSRRRGSEGRRLHQYSSCRRIQSSDAGARRSSSSRPFGARSRIG
jgi:hypothetical protein